MECNEVMARDQRHPRTRIGSTHCCRLPGGKLIFNFVNTSLKNQSIDSRAKGTVTQQGAPAERSYQQPVQTDATRKSPRSDRRNEKTVRGH